MIETKKHIPPKITHRLPHMIRRKDRVDIQGRLTPFFPLKKDLKIRRVLIKRMP